MSLTRRAKIDLLKAVKSEDEFRDEILVPIFYEMNQFKDVEVTHGAAERGKDVVLVEEDPFGEYIYTAVIIKNKDITNAVNPGKNRESTSIVVNQIVLTINSGYQCKLQKKHVNFNKIMVITSQNISHTAIEEFNKLAKAHGNINIIYKENSDVIALIDKYLPSFYESVTGKLSSYISTLKIKCQKLNELKNISIYKGEIRNLLDVYVSPTLYRVNKKELPGKGIKTTPVYGKLEKVIHEKKNVIIVGGPGSGKSTLIRAQIQYLISLNTRGKKINVPFLIKANEITTYITENDLIKSLELYLIKELDIKDFDIKKYFDGDNYRNFIFIDGFDEIRARDKRSLLKSKVNEFAELYPNIKVVITSREVEDLETHDMPTFYQWQLLQFNSNQIKKFLQRWFTSDKSNRLLSVLKDHELIEKLPSTPIVLTLLAILYDDEKQVEIPANLSELYQMFIDLLIGRWSLDRTLDCFYKANFKEFILMVIAQIMHESERYSITQDEFKDILSKYCIDFIDEGSIEDLSDLEKELFEQTCLIVLNDKKEIEFRHLSFQEFLVAKRYIKSGDPSYVDKLKNNFIDEWWSQVVYFYFGLRQENKHLLIELINVIEESRLIPSVRAICEYGYLVQASYLTPLTTRKECINKIIVIYSERAKKILDNALSGVIKIDFPPVLMLLSMIFYFKVHYSTRFLVQVYKDLYNNFLLNDTKSNFINGLQLLLVASVLSEIEGPECLIEIYDHIKDDSLLNIALEYEITMSLETREVSAKIKGELKKVMRKTRENIFRNKDYCKQYFDSPKLALDEIAATSEE